MKNKTIQTKELIKGEDDVKGKVTQGKFKDEKQEPEER